MKKAELPYCVASSANVEKMHITLGKTGLIGHFQDVLYSASMVARGKPFPDLFLHAAKEMGCEPSQAVVIEDSVAGTKAGTAAGMRVFSYCGDKHADHEGLAAAGGILLRRHAQIARIAGRLPDGEPLECRRHAHGR